MTKQVREIYSLIQICFREWTTGVTSMVKMNPCTADAHTCLQDLQGEKAGGGEEWSQTTSGMAACTLLIGPDALLSIHPI